MRSNRHVHMAAEDVKAASASRRTATSTIDGARYHMPPPPSSSSPAIRVGTTTRSGRRSVPVLDFWRTGGTDARSILTESSLEKQHLTGAECKSRPSSKKTAARTREKTPCDERTDLVAACSMGAGLLSCDVSNRFKAAISSQEQKAVECVSVDVRLGAAPVLDWWRNQRSTNAAADGGVVEAAQTPEHQNHVNPGKPLVSGSGTSYFSPELKTVDHLFSGGEATWTEDQLHSLRVAQAGTDPSTSDFWGAVAGRVEGRDSLQCQQKWFEHIATPRGRPRKGSKRCLTSLKQQTPLTGPSTNQHGDQEDFDDLFQATPVREARRVGPQQPSSDEVEAKTPKTPPGPGAPHDDALVAKATPEDGYAKRVVSRTYVQAMAKKIRKGVSQSVGSRVTAGGRDSIKAPCGEGGRFSAINAADISREHRLKAYVSSSGAVCVASTCSSDENSFGLPDDQESDDE